MTTQPFASERLDVKGNHNPDQPPPRMTFPPIKAIVQMGRLRPDEMRKHFDRVDLNDRAIQRQLFEKSFASTSHVVSIIPSMARTPVGTDGHFQELLADSSALSELERSHFSGSRLQYGALTWLT
jgi:hypothetical protein